MSRPARTAFAALVASCVCSAPGPLAARPLTLADAVGEALAHNLGLKVSAIDVVDAEQRTLELAAAFATRLDAEAFFQHANAASPFNPTSLQRKLDPHLKVGLSRRLDFGTELGVSVTSTWLDYEAERVGAVAFGDARGLFVQLGMTLRQPLLRGFGSTVGLAPIDAAAHEAHAARAAREQASSDLARRVEHAYWEAAYAQAAVAIRRTGVALAEREIENTRARLAAGTASAVDLLRVETARASRFEEQVAAEQVSRDACNALAVLLGTDDAVTPSDVPGERAPARGGDDAVEVERRALAASPELRALEAGRRAAERAQEAAHNAVLPALDVVAGAAWLPHHARESADPTRPDAPRDYASSGEGFSYRAGLVFSYPLGNEGAEASLERARAATSRLDAQIEDRRRDLAARVRTAAGQLASARERLRAAAAAARLAERTLEAEQTRQRTGVGVVKDVLDAQAALEETSLREARARIDTLQAAALLEHLGATLLDRWGLADPARP
jgi:outer membrane protein TolC